MPKGLPSISEWVIHLQCSESVTPPRGCMLHHFLQGGPQRWQIYHKNNSAFSHVPVLKSGGADFFFHKEFVVAPGCFKPLFISEILFSLIFIVLFCVLWAISNLLSKMPMKRGSFCPWLLSEILEHVDLDSD